MPMKSVRDERRHDPTAVPWDSLPWKPHEMAVMVVDHGSQREESNRMLPRIVDLFSQSSRFEIVEPAHMELAEPSIATAFNQCVARGAKLVVIHPYFLLPGRHWDTDIPRLATAAAARHPGVRFLVTAPLGLHTLMARMIETRVEQCLAHALGLAEPCELCAGTPRCQLD